MGSAALSAALGPRAASTQSSMDLVTAENIAAALPDLAQQLQHGPSSLTPGSSSAPSLGKPPAFPQVQLAPLNPLWLAPLLPLKHWVEALGGQYPMPHMLLLPVLLPWLHQEQCTIHAALCVSINQDIFYTGFSGKSYSTIDSQCRRLGLVDSRASLKRRKPCHLRMLSGIGCRPAGLQAPRLELSSRYCFDLLSCPVSFYHHCLFAPSDTLASRMNHTLLALNH